MSSTSVSQSKRSAQPRINAEKRRAANVPLQASEFKIEWLYSNLRWFYLMAVTAVLGMSAFITTVENAFTPQVIALLITGATANLLVMLLLMRNAFNKPLSS